MSNSKTSLRLSTSCGNHFFPLSFTRPSVIFFISLATFFVPMCYHNRRISHNNIIHFNIFLVQYIVPCEHTGTRPCMLLLLTVTTTEKSLYGMSFLGSITFIMNFALHTNFYTCTTDSSTHGALIIPHGHCVDDPSTKSEKQYLFCNKERLLLGRRTISVHQSPII